MANQIYFRRGWAEHKLALMALVTVASVGIALCVVGAVLTSPIPGIGLPLLFVIEMGIVIRLQRQTHS